MGEAHRPTQETGLARELRLLVNRHHGGAAEAEALCDRIAFLVGGRIVAEGTSAELRAAVAQGRPVEDVDLEDVFMALTGKTVEEDEEEVILNG